ncbi:MAG: hypothetical protein MI757_12820, partial [Pirellulales bacterium]|nr:hypothetical protein [Pirellulales bacterium]
MRRCHDRVLYLVLFGVVACGCNTPRGVQSPVLPPAPVGAKSPRAGSTLASETKPTSPPAEKTTVEQPAADAKPTGDDTSIASLMRDLDKAGKLDDATKARLLADLKKTPREQWPMIINVLRASLEYEKPETQPDVTPPPAEVATEVPTQPVDDFVVIEPSREASPLLTESEPAKAANPVRTPEIDKQPDPKQVARPDEDALALSKRNMLRAHDASGNDPLASQNPIRRHGYPSTDQPPLDPPTSASSEKVKLVSAETDSPLRAPSALPQAPQYAKPTSWNAALEETIAMLEENSGDHDPATQAKLRLLYLAAGRRSDANQEVPGVSEDAKAYWSEQVYA